MERTRHSQEAGLEGEAGLEITYNKAHSRGMRIVISGNKSGGGGDGADGRMSWENTEKATSHETPSGLDKEWAVPAKGAVQFDVGSSRPKRGARKGAKGDEKEKISKRPKFSISLSRKEIENDFLAMTNQRPPRRPMKRSKTVQRELDALFPGLGLTRVTAAKYKVRGPAMNSNASSSTFED